jgi:hypothetical protein
MDLRRTALYLSRTRVGFGLAMLASPRLAFGAVYGPGVDDTAGRVVTRMMGAREVALGAGGAISVGERRGSADWVSMLALADGLDAVVNLTSRGLGWRGKVLGVVAAASSVTHLALAKRLASEVDGVAVA